MLVYQRHKNYRVTFSRPRIIVDVLEVDTDSIRKTKKKYSDWNYKGFRLVDPADDLPPV